MKIFRRAGLAVVATASAVLVTPSAANADASSFTPSPNDFAHCPALPSGAVKLLWNCVAITLDGGKVKFGSVSQDPGSITIDIAVGVLDGKIVTITGPFGASSAIADHSVVRSGGVFTFSTQIEGAGPIQMKGLLPSAIPVKVHVSNWMLGGGCYIGTDGDPIVIRPVVSGLGLQVISGRPVIHATVSDSTFSVPGASGCGLWGMMNPVVNSYAGIPSGSGNNSVAFDTYLQIKNYQLGNITAREAAKLA
ncbi:hypothetical protein [Actinomadura oligospora]|uniref:hypothetical protein n=1 Tax=Actinomadura oligospora TaxID=111804 RepID=UPI0004AF3A64|nr:hypothetical protein [Actinomadura oligospora]